MKQDYFNNWSPDMAYYLGWLWADGNISEGKLQLGCCTEDEEVLIGLMKALGSNHSISRLPGRNDAKLGNVKPYTKTAIYCKPLIECLVEKHGLIPRKTYQDPPFPIVEPSFIKDFVRGYFDGDGCLDTQDTFSMVGTEKFMQGVQQIITQETGLPAHALSRNKKTKTITAAWSAKPEVLTLLNYIYSSRGPRLSRKKNLADKIRPELEEWCRQCGVEDKNGRIRLRFLGRRLGEYKSIDQCVWARNFAHQSVRGYPYPVIASPIPIIEQQKISALVNCRLTGDKIHQRRICPFFGV